MSSPTYCFISNCVEYVEPDSPYCRRHTIEDDSRKSAADAEAHHLVRMVSTLSRLAHIYDFMRHNAIDDKQRNDIRQDAHAAILGLVQDWL